jgi:hypothetical protein
VNPTSQETLYSSAYAVANGLLLAEDPVTDDVLNHCVATVTTMAKFKGLDPVRLKKMLETNINVHVPGYSVIDDKEFRSWIKVAQETRDFAFWNRYRNYLEKKRRIPRDVLNQLDNLTDDILDRLRDPKTAGQWDRRGLVVGDVQSGKTGNYIGLVCKAVDAGFPLIIVLAGIHNSLRSQTQLRMDEGFLGFDTRLNMVYGKENQRIGAGALPDARFLVAHSLTSSMESGDFRLGVAQGTKIVPGGKDPVVLVVKKQYSILTNLISWVLSVRGIDDPEHPGSRIIRDVPLLVIDDEADNASANTNEYRDEDGSIDPENDPTRTNSLIRQLLTAFEKSAYVGYTATPFANVFIHHEATSELVNKGNSKHTLNTRIGEDLFPRSFIINIPAPDNYIGPEKVFGIARPGAEEAKGLPIIVDIDDTQLIFPLGHKKSLKVETLPDSLKDAVLAFVLTCAARRARGDTNVHNSMLVHVTRFTDVQAQVAELLKEELDDVRQQLEYPGTGGKALGRLEALWRKEFASKMDALGAALPWEDLRPIEWKEVKAHLFDAAKPIAVRAINGSAKDALDYADHPDGLSVVAVGGDKLSRGLTLEGLSVSYFIRTAKMYDTLMQMGRWFGYRPRYADLCRLFTSQELVRWYQHIAIATSELREEFDLMMDQGRTPLEFGNRVRTHPDGMLITAANKMRAGTKIRAGFSGTISETVSFETAAAEDNFRKFSIFLEGLPKNSLQRGRYIWNAVSGNEVLGLIGKLQTAPDSWKANSQAIAQYIEERLSHDRLKSWTVVLLAAGNSGKSRKIGGYDLQLIERKDRSGSDPDRYSIGRLVSPADEQLDLTEAQKEAALVATRKLWKEKKEPKGDMPDAPSGPCIRTQRDVRNGLLLIYPIDGGDKCKEALIGFAVSFPSDPDGALVEYAENSVKRDMLD